MCVCAYVFLQVHLGDLATPAAPKVPEEPPSASDSCQHT